MLHSPDLAQSPHTSVPLEIDGLAEQAEVRRRRFWRILRWTLAIIALLVVVVVGGLALVISQSIELPFLRHQVDATIEQALGEGYDAKVGGAALGIDPVLGLVVKLSDISVVDSLDQEVARVPSAMLAVSVGGLFNSRETVRSIEIDNAWFSIRRDDGLAILGNDATPSTAAPTAETEATANDVPHGFAPLADPIEAVDKALEDAMALAGRGFGRIDIYNASIELWTGSEDVPHVFERTDLRILADPDTRHLAATLTASGYSGRWSVSADRMVNPLTGGRTLSLQFSQLTLADFFPAVGGTPSFITTDIPFYGRAIIGIDADGHVATAEARLDLGVGYFAFGPTAKPIFLDDATIHLRWDVPNQILNVEPSPFIFGNSGATITGTVRPDGPGRYAFDLQSNDAVLAPRDSPAPALDVQQLRLAGAVDLDAGLLNFDRAAIVTANGSLVAAGSIGLEPGGPSIALAATLTEMPMAVFKQIWPAGLQDGGRDWTLQAVTGGTVDGTLAAQIPAGALAPGGTLTTDMLDLELDLHNVSFKTFDGFPGVTDASGRAVLSGAHFAVDLDDGTIVAPSGEVLDITTATFVINETDSTVPTGRLEVHTTGPAAAYSSIADMDPINALRQFGISPSDIHGIGEAQASANWPLVDGVTIDEVQWRIALTLNDLTSDAPLNDMMIRNGDVLFNITPTVVDITGAANIDGVPADVDLAFPLVAEVDGRQQLRMVLDEEARRQLGFNLEGFLGGTVRAAVTDLGPNGPGQHYDLDLEQARLILAPLGWSKPVGVPATMSFDLLSVDGGYHIRNLVLDGNGFGLTGEVELDADYAITGARVTDFGLTPADSASFTYLPRGEGWAIEATGATFDIRGLISDGLGDLDNGSGDTTDLAVHGHFDELIGFNGERIQNADVTYVAEGGAVRQIEVTGTLGGAPVSVSFDDTNGEGGATLSAYVGSAGALLRFANIYDRIHGGVLAINGAETADGSLYGQVQMTDFTVVGEPALTRLMTPQGTEADATDAVPFDRLGFGYVQRGSALTIQDILLRGGDMGATGAGWIDFNAGQMAIAGTYIPAYAVNNIFGRIPILGLALGGGNNEGLFGITFQVAGPLDDVHMEINPLSAIAPGIFRKIFQFQ